MKKAISKFILIILLAALAIPCGASAAYGAAAGATTIGGSCTISKKLVVNYDANIPDITFTYSITRMPGVAATSNTLEILKSPLAASIETASFSNSDKTRPGSLANTSYSTASEKKYAQKEITITFPDGSFPVPGIYRYVINESCGSYLGVTYDTTPRYLDVVVKSDEDGFLKIDSCILMDKESPIGLDGKYTDESASKCDGFSGSITQHNLEFTEAIINGRGLNKKLFTFSISIEGAIPGVYPLLASSVPGSTPQAVTVGSDGHFTGSFNLADKSSIRIIGLNEGTRCYISEDSQYYSVKHKIDTGSEINNSIPAVITMDADHKVSFTHTNEVVITNNILMSVAPFTAGMVLFGIALIALVSRLKTSDDT